jgi:hypothetical protein
MDLLQSLTSSLLSPMVLAFVLGVVATLLRSDLKLPEELYVALTIYLLLAIGMKGGMELEGMSLSVVGWPIASAVVLSVVIPVWSFFILRSLVKLDTINAAAIAAHYGSVSAVTFSAVAAFLENSKVRVEGFAPALLAVMEAPAIIVAVCLAMRQNGAGGPSQPAEFKRLLHDLLAGKGIILLVGGLVIGLVSGARASTRWPRSSMLPSKECSRSSFSRWGSSPAAACVI